MSAYGRRSGSGAGIVLVLFILLVIILIAANGRSRYVSDANIDLGCCLGGMPF
ncbi:hypothetical protein VQL36_02565 [Chengkuizengella sp. SCS-71B]|uniref:hypothetical protein n=1 Tax=Chengkuizengella sp. SCS-71B TaxID=3115290 RepID=UPI0032C248E1